MLRQARPTATAGTEVGAHRPHNADRNITAVAVAVRMDLPVFLPQDRHRHAGPLQLARKFRPVRFDPPPLASRYSRAPKELELQGVVGDILAQRPFQPRRRRPFQVVLDRRARHAKAAPDLTRAHAVVVKAQ